jgi:hypothetical protein
MRNRRTRRLSVQNHNEVAKGTLRTRILEAGLTVEEFVDLLFETSAQE